MREIFSIANAEPDRNSIPPDPAGSASFYNTD